MDVMPFLIVGASFLSIGIPLLGTIAVWTSLYAVSPYVRKVFLRNVGLRSPDNAIKRLSLALTPWAFVLVGIGCVTIALLFEVALAVILQFVIGTGDVSSFILVVSAGPIEEGSKLAVAIVAFIALQYLLSSIRGRDAVKDGILIGMFVGCSFGFAESIGYLLLGFSELLSHGSSYSTVDPIVWRIVLGVIIHGMYASIASIGIGRSTSGGRFLWTAIGLSAAVALHSLNNGIQGLFLLILGMEGLPIYIIIDISQLVLVLIGAGWLIYVWRTREASPVP